MSWEGILKEGFDWDKNMENIFERVGVVQNITRKLYFYRDAQKEWTPQQVDNEYDSLIRSLHKLQSFYERNKEKLQ